MVWISPKQQGDGTDPATWSIEDQIEVFFQRIDGWHLEIADKAVNGWPTNGKPSITTIVPEYGNVTAHFIPHAAWAGLQIVINYFEMIRAYQMGEDSSGQSRAFFIAGFVDVFPEYKEQPEVSEILWTHLRNGLYHTGFSSSHIILRVQEKALLYNKSAKQLIIDPHKLIPLLRGHLVNYVRHIKDPNSSYDELRANFQKMFIGKSRR